MNESQAHSLVPGRRLSAAVELSIFALAVLLWDVTGLPRSIIPLFLLGWVSLRLRGLNWRDVGLRAPESWARTSALGVGLGVSIQLVGSVVVLPFLSRVFGLSPVDPRDMAAVTTSLPLFLVVLVGQWVLAGLGEETVYRGYVLNRLTDLIGEGRLITLGSVVLSSALFSAGHGAYGLPFFVLTFAMGCLYSSLYLLSGRNLWLSVITHATANSIGITLAFVG